jgi:predicted carbohydrate-binding protein with CBM5 and CBM33 domain
MASRTARMAALLGTAAATLLVGVIAAVPARAHGAPTSPVSRTYECGTESGLAGSPACRAALAASGRSSMADWDEVRVPNVGGQDRTKIPDGRICSGGLDRYHGLDLPRADWPTTTLAPGASLAFAYRTTIPHSGMFRVYVTRDGWDPAKPLTWSEVETTPFATATDPPVTNDAYHFVGRLPAKTGRHIILTIWQNTSTPDTYYSCSDVRFAAAAAKRAPATPAKPAAPPAKPATPATPATPPATSARPPHAAHSATPATPAATTPGSPAPRPGLAAGTGNPASFDTDAGSTAPLIAGIAGAVVVAAAGLGYGLLRRRRTGRHSL